MAVTVLSPISVESVGRSRKFSQRWNTNDQTSVALVTGLSNIKEVNITTDDSSDTYTYATSGGTVTVSGLANNRIVNVSAVGN